jgi:CubicO group peptidase (beta-lactamase class C family)
VELTPARIIERAVADRAFPAAVVETGTSERAVWRQAFGALTYEHDSPPTREDTVFDLASLTKVIATTTIAMRAVDEGRMGLDERVADRLSQWRGADREQVTIADLLEHASGLTAYLPFFRDHRGRPEFERAICTMPLEYAPRTQSIYSDLGFILLAFILEDAYAQPFASVFDTILGSLRPGSASDPLFNPPRELRERCAPTELDLWRGRLLQGEVHDENCYTLGGSAGHAGLFGTAEGVGSFARVILNQFGSRTLERFVRKSTVPGSSRALGWDTMLPTSSCGTSMSQRAIGHTGFTGTSLWIDPERDLYVVMLTNRVHPSRENNQIRAVRRSFHDALAKASTADWR